MLDGSGPSPPRLPTKTATQRPCPDLYDHKIILVLHQPASLLFLSPRVTSFLAHFFPSGREPNERPGDRVQSLIPRDDKPERTPPLLLLRTVRLSVSMISALSGLQLSAYPIMEPISQFLRELKSSEGVNHSLDSRHNIRTKIIDLGYSNQQLPIVINNTATRAEVVCARSNHIPP